jgi:hypothetical protein
MFSETCIINGYYTLEKSVSQIFELTYWDFLMAVECWATVATLSAMEHH